MSFNMDLKKNSKYAQNRQRLKHVYTERKTYTRPIIVYTVQIITAHILFSLIHSSYNKLLIACLFIVFYNSFIYLFMYLFIYSWIYSWNHVVNKWSYIYDMRQKISPFVHIALNHATRHCYDQQHANVWTTVDTRKENLFALRTSYCY